MWDISILGYSLYELFWFFTIYSVLGWCSEVIFCTVNTGKLVNRGFLNGPVCPIYGFGMLIVLCVLGAVQDHLTLLFVGGALLTSALELGAGYALKKLFHTQWWDYSDKPFNLGGYICLSFSLLWGVLIVMVVKVIHPPIAQLVAMVPRIVGEIVAVPVFLIFLADFGGDGAHGGKAEPRPWRAGKDDRRAAPHVGRAFDRDWRKITGGRRRGGRCRAAAG